MHISVAKFGGEDDLLTIEIAPDLSINDLKVVIESESNFGIKADEMNLYHEGKLVNVFFLNLRLYLFFTLLYLGKLLTNVNQTLEQSNLKDYDVLICQKILCMLFSEKKNNRYC